MIREILIKIIELKHNLLIGKDILIDYLFMTIMPVALIAIFVYMMLSVALNSLGYSITGFFIGLCIFISYESHLAFWEEIYRRKEEQQRHIRFLMYMRRNEK